MVAIALRGLTVRHRLRRGEVVTALDGIDLDLPSGRVTAVTGPAGCGKSTLLRVVAGLDAPTEGQVRFDDVDVTAQPTRVRDVALVTQDVTTFPHRTVRAQIGEPLRYQHVDTAEVDDRVLAEARVLGIEALLDRRPHGLSAGDRQRVALARATVRRPRAFLLDEPFSAADPPERLRLRGELLALQRGLGVTTVHVTHDVAEAMAVGDRLAVLDSGRLVQVDAPQALYDRPATTQVAVLLDEATRLLDAEVDDRTLHAGGVALPLGSGQRRAVAGHRRVTLAVRPGALRAEDAAAGVALAGELVGPPAAGPRREAEVRVDLGGGHTADLVAQLPAATRARPGDGLLLRLDVGACQLYDTEGRALHHGRGQARP